MELQLVNLMCVGLMLVVSLCGVLSQPLSFPPPPGTNIEPPRVDPPSWQLAVGCLPDPRIPMYTPYYNLASMSSLNTSLIYRLSEADVTGPMSDLVVTGFLSHWSNVNITTYRYGSGSVGICLAGANTTVSSLSHPYCDMAVVTREIGPVSTTSAELALFQYKTGYQPMEVPVLTGSYNALGFSDAMVFFVHGSNPLRNITLAQLDAILSTTRNRGYPNQIVTWDQLGVTDPAFFNKTINVYGSTLGNGFDVFLNRVILQGGNWYTGNLNQSLTVKPIGALVTQDKFGLGFAGISYLNQSGINVFVNVLDVAWNNNCPAIPLNQATHCSRAYPLSRFIYFYANLPPNQASLDPVIYEFLNYLLSYDGQLLMRSAQSGVFYPLPYTVLMNIRQKYLVVRNPLDFVDGTGSRYFNSTTCNSPYPATPYIPPPVNGATSINSLKCSMPICVLLAIFSWMAAVSNNF